jgi:hypothetical protein
MLLAVGGVFMNSSLEQKVDSGEENARARGAGTRAAFVQKLLLGITMSGLNPGFLGTYGGAIATGNEFTEGCLLLPLLCVVYSTGVLVFSIARAILFGIGVCSGICSWFTIMLALLKKHKQVPSPPSAVAEGSVHPWFALGPLYLKPTLFSPCWHTNSGFASEPWVTLCVVWVACSSFLG